MTRPSAESLKSLNQAMGRLWEKDVLLWLQALGFNAEECGNFNDQFDICVNGKNVEVKSAHKTQQDNGNGTIRNRYIFNLRAKKDIDNYFCVLVCVGDYGKVDYFFIPGDKIQGSTITITSEPEKYNGKWSKYLNNHEYLTDWLESTDTTIESGESVPASVTRHTQERVKVEKVCNVTRQVHTLFVPYRIAIALMPRAP